MENVAEVARSWSAEGRRAVAGRVVEVEGFSTWTGDEMVAVDAAGEQHGDMLGRPGAQKIQEAAASLLRSGTDGLGKVVLEIKGAEVAEAGLACGGRAEVLLQPISTIPEQLWDLLGRRAPAALVTCIEGPGSGPASMVVDASGTTFGPSVAGEDVVKEAVAVLAAGHSATRRIEAPDGRVLLLEAWVPAPRLVIVGSGELRGALDAQGRLLGWESRSTETPSEVDGLLDWAGASAALVVLSHDPHVDAPALATALRRGVPYVGALGSRSTQSRRLERLAAMGLDKVDLDRIHRPVGLDLGGRSAPEVALAICAEILACHCGRDARPLAERGGPIHERPRAAIS